MSISGRPTIVALLAMIINAAGCDVAETGATAAKTEAQIKADVEAGKTRDVIVVLADQPAQSRRAALRAAIPGERFASYLKELKADLDGIKANVMAAVPAAAESVKSFDNLPLLHLRVNSPEALAALEGQAEVAAVVEDRPLRAFETTPPNLTLIGQPQAALAGKLGAGTTVVVLDTGTDYKRAPFNCTVPGSPAECPVVFAQDFAEEDQALDEGGFHGTNVAGTVLAVG